MTHIQNEGLHAQQIKFYFIVQQDEKHCLNKRN